MNKRSITNGLEEIGAAWAVTSAKTVLPDDPFGSKPAYHIHPDQTYPHVQNIIRFDTLAGVAEYIEMRRMANRAGGEEAGRIMAAYWYEH